MSEKEERIAIAKMITRLDDDGSAQLDHFKIYSRYKIYSRKEAIERMAKALAFVQAKTFVDKNQWEIVMRGCRYEAEAALNALLGE